MCKQDASCRKQFMFVLALLLTVTSFMPFSVSNAADQAPVTLSPLQEQYQPGDIVDIAGTSSFQTVTLKIIGPGPNNIFYIDVLKVDANHMFNTRIRLPDDIVLGSYTVVVGVSQNVATATFTVTKKENASPSPKPAPSPEPTPSPEPAPSPEPTPTEPQEPSPTPQKPPTPTPEEKTVTLKDGQATIKTNADQSRDISIEINANNIQQALSQGAQTITLDIKTIELKENDRVIITIPASIANELVTKKTAVNVNLPALTIGIPGEALSAFIDAQGTLSLRLSVEQFGKDGSVQIAMVKAIHALTPVYTIHGDKLLPKPVTLSFDVPETALDLRKAMIYHKETASSMWQALPHQTHDGRTYSGTSRTFGSYAVLIVQKTFSDIQNHWGKDVIEVLASRGIVSGVDANYFQPERHVTRAEFAALMLKALQLDQETYPMPFQDVSPTAWYNKVVGTAYHYGLMKGDGTKFRPNDPITREEMAVVIVNATRAVDTKRLGLKLNPAPSAVKNPSFADSAQISSWAKEAVAQAQAEGWISGMGDNLFAPKKNTKRAEAAAVLFKLVVGQ
ncbi:MAG: S-layer homology domain-containing protein [Candidatus Carbobacillus altaicus]|nr:S-layer homology domain-containing protein [Candidatus Carbobacillus altaicus]